MSVMPFEIRKVEGVRVRFWNSVEVKAGLVLPINLINSVGFDKVALDIAADQLRMDGYTVSVRPLGDSHAWEMEGKRYPEHDGVNNRAATHGS